jgi:hypothetical protein
MHSAPFPYLLRRLLPVVAVACPCSGCVGEGILAPSADGGATTEQCNFRDDDGDGAVDEGFDWKASEWSTVLTVANPKHNISYLEAISLGDGRVAVAGIDGQGAGPGDPDKAFVVTVSAGGALVDGPTEITIDTSGGNYANLISGPTGEIAAAFGGTDYTPDCAKSCPVYVVRLDAASLNVLDAPGSGPAPLSLPFTASGVVDLAWAPTGYVLLTVENGTGQLHLSWLDSTGTAVTRDEPVGEGATASGAVAAGPGGLGWLRSTLNGTSFNSVIMGVHTLDGLGVVLADTEIAAGVSTGLQSLSRSLLWLGDSIVVSHAASPAGTLVPLLSVWSTSGKALAGPTAVGGQGTVLSDMVPIDGNLVILRDNATVTATLLRLRADLTPVETPAGGTVLTTQTSYLALAPTSTGLLAFRGAAGSGDGSTNPRLQVARIGCP